MKIPNRIIDNMNRNVIKVACKLYSLINADRVSKNGYEVCIKQESIAQSCNLSLSTVKRCISELEKNKIITHKYRVTYDNGCQGCYHYSLALIIGGYTNIRYDIFTYDLSSVEFMVYVHFCKLRSNGINSFYQSLNELESIININKSTLCKIITKLIEYGLIRKQLKKTKLGDYTDNTYFVIARIRGGFSSSPSKQLRNNVSFVSFIILAKNEFVKRSAKKIFQQRKRTKIDYADFFDSGGSG